MCVVKLSSALCGLCQCFEFGLFMRKFETIRIYLERSASKTEIYIKKKAETKLQHCLSDIVFRISEF